MKYKILTTLCLFLVLVALLFAWLDSSRDAISNGAIVALDSDTAFQEGSSPSAEQQPSRSSGTREKITNSIEEANLANRALVRINVLDAVSRRPVMATVDVSQGDTLVHSAVTFGFTSLRCFLAGDQPIVVTGAAPNYHSSEITVNLKQGKRAVDVELKLRPRTSIRARVVDSAGQPLEGVEVVASPLPGQDSEAVQSIVQSSASDGQVIFQSGEALRMSLATQPLVQFIGYPDGSTVQLIKNDQESKVKFLDSQLYELIENLSVIVRSASSPGVEGQTLVTGKSGEINLSGLRYPVSIQFPHRNVEIDEQALLDLGSAPFVTLVKNGLILSQQDKKLGSATHIPIKRLAPSIVLRNAGTNALLTGEARYRFEFLEGGEVKRSARWVKRTLIKGRLALQSMRISRGGLQIRVSAQGFVSRVLDENLLREISEPKSGTLEVSLQPLSSIQIRLLDDAETPWRGEIIALTAGTNDIVWSGRPRTDGGLSNFYYSESDVEIVPKNRPGEQMKVSADGRSRTIAQIPQAKLKSGEEITVRVNSPACNLVVMEIPDGAPPIIAMHESGARFMPELDRTLSEALFIGIPAGGYLVGPPTFIESIWTRKHNGPLLESVDIPAGESRSVLWDSDWLAEAPTAGRVVLPPDIDADIGVVPVYGRLGSAPLIGRSMATISLDHLGNYELPSNAPIPSALVIVSGQPPINPKSAYLLPVRVLAVCKPGGEFVLPFRIVSLVRDDDRLSSRDTLVRYKVPVGLSDLGLNDLKGAYSNQTWAEVWRAADSRHKILVPTSNTEIQFEGSGREWLQNVGPNRDQLEVSWPD